MSSALSSAGYFKSHFCKQCGPRSDCSFRSSLIWVHTVCLYAKCKFEKFVRRCSRRHKQTTFSDADFLGALRVKGNENTFKGVKSVKVVSLSSKKVSAWEQILSFRIDPFDLFNFLVGMSWVCGGGGGGC